jgi:o-succinylbenzoate synthase
MIANHYKYILDFKNPSGTSRGILTQKETWFLIIESNGKKGVGECGILRGLSIDDRDDYEEKLAWTCKNIHLGLELLLSELIEFPSIQFGLETAFLSLESKNPFELFPSKFTKGEESIYINGLIWMGSNDFMLSQIQQKLKDGFKCIKLKIGAIDFEKEIALLKYIRTYFNAKTIEIRLDANGAFSVQEAQKKIEQLAHYEIHSIEQPIATNQIGAMQTLCKNSPISIALDEELIGVFTKEAKEVLIQKIQPPYIILKPSLVGGFRGTQEWIEIAEKNNVGWWITSALESNVGLNAIAQWTYLHNNTMPQGLGTGGLFTNNFDCPLEVNGGNLWYKSEKSWDFNLKIVQ